MVVDYTVVEAELPGDQVGTLHLHAASHDLGNVAENGLVIERPIVLECRGGGIEYLGGLLVIADTRLEQVGVDLQSVVQYLGFNPQLEVESFLGSDIRRRAAARKLHRP